MKDVIAILDAAEKMCEVQRRTEQLTQAAQGNPSMEEMAKMMEAMMPLIMMSYLKSLLR